MAPPRGSSGSSKAAPPSSAAPAAAPGPPSLPSIDPPEAWEGRRLASQLSTTSDASEAPNLLAMGAPWAAQALAASAAAAAADPSGAVAGGRSASPAARPPRGDGRLRLQGSPSLVRAGVAGGSGLQQYRSSRDLRVLCGPLICSSAHPFLTCFPHHYCPPPFQVDAVVHMQALPTSVAASPALHTSQPGAAAAAGAAGPAAAGRGAAGPAGREEAALDERPPLLPASSASSSASSSISPTEEAGHEPEPSAPGGQAEEGEEGEEADEDDDGASFSSAASGRYLTPGSSVAPDPPGSPSSIDGGRSASPQHHPAGAAPTWQPLQPTAEPPPRPGGSSSGSASASGSCHAAPGSAINAASTQSGADALDRRTATPPCFARLDSEGVHAPPPSPAGSSAPSASSSAVPSAAVSPAVTHKSSSPTGHKRFGAAPAGAAPTAPASPATPAAYAAAPPRPQWQPQAATAPLNAEQQPGAQKHAQQGAAAGASSWPGAPPPWRQPPPPRPLQGAFVPHRRSRLAQEGGGAADTSPAMGSEAAGQPLPPSAASAFIPSGEAGETQPQQPAAAAASAESRAAAASGWAQHSAQEPGRQQQQQQHQGGEADSTPSSSAGEPQLTEIRGEWPPPPAEPEAPGPWAATQASSVQLQQAPSLGWGGMRSAFQAAAQWQQGQQSPARSPAWRHLDDGSWQEPGGEVDWEGPSAFGASWAAAGAAGTAGTRGDQVEALIHDSLVEAASHSPPLSPTTTRLLALHRPSGELRRGPQRAASLGLGLSLPEHQPSMLSPERQHSRLASQPTSPLFAGAAQHASPPPLGSHSGHLSSWPSSPAAHRPAAQPSFRMWGQQADQLPSPAPSGGLRRSCDGSCVGGRQAGMSSPHEGAVHGGSATGDGTAGTASAMSGSSVQPPAFAMGQPERLPVLNASPDVAGADAAQPPTISPFRAPSAGGLSPASRHGALGGLPLPPAMGLEAGAVDKRDSRWLQSADLSPREVRAVVAELQQMHPAPNIALV